MVDISATGSQMHINYLSKNCQKSQFRVFSNAVTVILHTFFLLITTKTGWKDLNQLFGGVLVVEKLQQVHVQADCTDKIKLTV